MDTQLNLSAVLTKILTIINYPQESHEAFISEFVYMSQLEALLNIIESLPKSEQEQIKSLSNSKNVEKIKPLIQKYTNSTLFNEEFEKQIYASLNDFLQSITPTLTPIQKQKIQEYLNTKTKADE